MNRGLKRRLLIYLVVLLLIVAYVYWGNTAVQVTEITVPVRNLPAEFSGYTVAHISDLHNNSLGKENQDLLRCLEEAQPDIIFLTGDMIDSRRTDVDVVAKFLAKAITIAPIYSVTGNHEVAAAEAYADLREIMLDLGVQVLEDERTTLTCNGASVALVGLRDGEAKIIEETLTTLGDLQADCTILLAHRPEQIGYYSGAGADAVFSGHAHGGQFRLPLIGGLVAPGQGIFPAYDAGLYTVNGTRLIVSRGLGNSRFPIRLNNRPELIIASFQPE